MPDRVELPNGEIIEFPDDMPLSEKNAVFTQAISKMERPVTVGIPGVISPKKMQAETFRGVTDLAGEVAGGTLGALGGLKVGGPFGAIAGAAAGSVGGKKAAQKGQEFFGVKPSEMTFDDAMETALSGGIGEMAGLPFAMRRVAKGVARMGADTKAAQANKKLLNEIGIGSPRLDLLLTDAGAKFDYGAIQQWASKNPMSSRIMKESADEAAEQMSRHFEGRWMIRGPEGDQLIPDLEMAGEAFREGLERINPVWRNQGAAKFNRVFRGIGRETPISWESTRGMLSDRASLDKVLSALGTDKMKKLSAALDEAYNKVIKAKELPGGGKAVLQRTEDIPFDKMKRLRTQVGNKISEWAPGDDIPRAELVDLYSALTDDLRKAADDFGVLDDFDGANKFWSENLRRQERIFDRIDGKLKSDAEVGMNLKRLVTIEGGDSKRIRELKGSFGAASEEWGVVQNYLLRQMGAGPDGNFNIRNVYKAWNSMSDRTKTALLGEGPQRRAMDSYLDAVEKFGYNIVDVNRAPYSRWTKAEILGPTTLLAGGAGVLGGGYAMSQDKGVGVPLAIVGTMALIAPRRAAKLMTDPKWTTWATEAMSKKPEAIAGSIGRLTAQFSTMEPEQKAAMAEYFHAFGRMFPGQQNNNPLGVMSGQGR